MIISKLIASQKDYNEYEIKDLYEKNISFTRRK